MSTTTTHTHLEVSQQGVRHIMDFARTPHDDETHGHRYWTLCDQVHPDAYAIAHSVHTGPRLPGCQACWDVLTATYIPPATGTPGGQPVTDDPTRLYGLPGAEVLHTDPHDALEEAWAYTSDDPPAQVTIEEWTVHPPRHELPDRDRLLEWITEYDNETDEYWYDQAANAVQHPHVVDLTGRLLDAIATRITYRMAADHVDTHTYVLASVGVNPEDGPPEYVRATPPQAPEEEPLDESAQGTAS